MAVAYVNSGAVLNSTGTTHTPSLPASIVAGNLLLAAHVSQDTPDHSWSAGWTQIGSSVLESGGRFSVAYRIATGGDTAPTITTSSSTVKTSFVSQYSGVSGIGASTANSGATTAHTNAGFTSTGDSSASVFIDMAMENAALSLPSGWSANVSSANSNSVHSGLKLLGSSGSASGAISTTGGQWWALWQLELLAIAPPAEGSSSKTLPAVTGSISGFTGNSSSLTIPAITGSMSGKQVFDGVGASAASAETAGSAIGVFALSAASVADSLSEADRTVITYGVGATAAVLGSAALAPRVFTESVDSGVAAVSAATYGRMVDLVAASAVVATGAGNAQALFFLTAESIAALSTGIQFVADFTDGWAYNLKTGAPSFYEGMRFNSFAMIDGEYYGANESGIHRLGADSDGGDEIDATLTLGTSRLDSDAIKSVPAVYLGGKSAEPMLLTCRVEGQEYSYEFSHAVAVTGVAKAKPGKGLKGVYWQMEIANQRGGDAEIETLEVLTAPTSRRI